MEEEAEEREEHKEIALFLKIVPNCRPPIWHQFV